MGVWHWAVPESDPQKAPERRKLTALVSDDEYSAVDLVTAYLRDKEGVERTSDSFQAVLACVASARTVLIEHGYFDIDSRSEDAATLTREFKFDKPLWLRLHFFKTALTNEALSDACVAGELKGAGYLGYTIPRRRRGAVTAGRTLVYPSASEPGLADPDDFHTRVRTMVREFVNLLGVKLEAHGVPFAEQDRVVTTCGHVAAWTAHFTSVLRGLAHRVPMAGLRGRDDGRFGRQQPSIGLADAQLLSALSIGGLDPRITYIADHDVPRSPTWYDRPEIHENPDGHTWHRDVFTSEVCRYLNSGLPVILGTGGQSGHYEVVCGYLRSRDFESHTTERPQSSQVEAFIVQDDVSGPYRVRPVQEILNDIDDADTVIVPMPRDLALSGSDAEYVCTDFFEQRCRWLVDPKGGLTQLQSRGGDEAVKRSHLLLAELEGHELAARTFAAFNTDFKASIVQRSPDRSLVYAISTLRLPRYVWVTEVVRRSSREPGAASVIGQVVVGGTMADATKASVVLIHTPDYVEFRDPVTGRSSGFFSPIPPMESGRWAQSRTGSVFDFGNVSERHKSTISSVNY